jgi:hypothetical protein
MSNLELNCWLDGDEPKKIFTVTVSHDANVSQLKVAVKGANDPDLNYVRAPNLVLWKAF